MLIKQLRLMENFSDNTLKQLGVRWQYEKDAINGSSIQQRTYKLYNNNSLCEYSVDDIRFMIGQEIGLEYLIPKAIRILKKDLFIEAGYYDGDLLKMVLLTDNSYWSKYPIQKKQIISFLESNNTSMDDLFLSQDIKINLIEAIKKFKSE